MEPLTHQTIDTDHAIRRVRRGAYLAFAVRLVLLLGIVAGFVLAGAGQMMIGGVLMIVTVSIMFALSGRTLRQHQLASRAALLLEAGRLDEAEADLSRGLSSFMLYRAPRLTLLQNLAALRHAQRRYREAMRLALELLRHRPRDPGSARALHLMVAECGLQTGDLHAVHASLSQIMTPMPLREMLKLMELQVEYCVRIGAWQQAAEQLPMKVELAELLPAPVSARVQGLLALASHKLDRGDWASWLKRRVELLADVPELLEQRPVLREVFS